MIPVDCLDDESSLCNARQEEKVYAWEFNHIFFNFVLCGLLLFFGQRAKINLMKTKILCFSIRSAFVDMNITVDILNPFEILSKNDVLLDQNTSIFPYHLHHNQFFLNLIEILK
jgi:hypothetical protein